MSRFVRCLQSSLVATVAGDVDVWTGAGVVGAAVYHEHKDRIGEIKVAITGT